MTTQQFENYIVARQDERRRRPVTVAVLLAVAITAAFCVFVLIYGSR